MTQQQQKNRTLPIIVMFFLFAMISFVTNLAAPMGTIWKGEYPALGMMGNMMNFLAYLFMGIPAGNMLVRIGYKKTALIAMSVGIVGLFTQYLSSSLGAGTELFAYHETVVKLNYIIDLLGAFICGFCVCMLNTVVNPMLNVLGGGGNKGNQLLQTGGALNSFSATLTPLFVGALIGTVTDRTAMSDVTPLLFIAMGIFMLAFVIISFVSIPEPHLQKEKAVKTKEQYSPWSFRHTVLGVIGIFIYVGVEIGIPGTLIFYLSDSSANGAGILVNGAAIGGAIAAIYWLLMLVGRLLGGVVGSKISSRAMLVTAALGAMLFIVLGIFTEENFVPFIGFDSKEFAFSVVNIPLNAIFFVLCGLFASIMWGAIFNLSVTGLGKYTAVASGIFMVMVCGGGIFPAIQSVLASGSILGSFWLPFALAAYILVYAMVLSRPSKNLPEEAEVLVEE